MLLLDPLHFFKSRVTPKHNSEMNFRSLREANKVRVSPNHPSLIQFCSILTIKNEIREKRQSWLFYCPANRTFPSHTILTGNRDFCGIPRTKHTFGHDTSAERKSCGSLKILKHETSDSCTSRTVKWPKRWQKRTVQGLGSVQKEEVARYCSRSSLPIDCICADGRFLMSPRGMAVSNTRYHSSSETRVNGGIRGWKLHLSESTLCQQSVDGICLTKK